MDMRGIAVGVAALILTAGLMLAGCQPAAPGAAAGGGGAAATPVSFPSGSPAPTTFTDPTEGAFTVAVPQGWTVKGGIQRSTPSVATPWITATSPDGASVISIGDPSIPPFIAPSQIHPPGQHLQTGSGVMGLVEPYESGVQFAQDYAGRTFAQTCQLQQTGSQSEPALAQAIQADSAQLAVEVGITPAQVQYDGGSATFSCEVNGVADTVGVIDVTGVVQSQVGTTWNVSTLIAYRTPAASQGLTDQIARTMRASFQRTPQWNARMIAATRQNLNGIQQTGTAEQAALTQQENADRAVLNNQETIANANLDAQHAATMNQLNQQQADRNAGVAQGQYNRETGQQAEIRDIQNQQCIQWYDDAHTRCAATAPY
jgi:hypothetical protein